MTILGEISVSDECFLRVQSRVRSAASDLQILMQILLRNKICSKICSNWCRFFSSDFILQTRNAWTYAQSHTYNILYIWKYCSHALKMELASIKPYQSGWSQPEVWRWVRPHSHYPIGLRLWCPWDDLKKVSQYIP